MLKISNPQIPQLLHKNVWSRTVEKSQKQVYEKIYIEKWYNKESLSSLKKWVLTTIQFRDYE
jgi:hypothetical protein